MRQLLINSDLLDSRILSSVYGTLELFMTGNLNLKEDSPPLIFLNPGGSNRFVNLPPLERGMSYRVSHIGVANTLTIRDFNSATVVTLAAGEVVDLTASATAWTFIAGSNETGTGGGGGLSNAYVALSDGTNSAVAVGSDTLKFRVGSLLTGVVTNDDVTHGDNVLFNHASYPALSVLANPTNAGAIPTTLAAGINGAVLWRNGTALTFTTLDLTLASLAGALPIANGGTAAINSQAAINNLGQLTTSGDLLFHNGTNHTRFPRGSNGQVLSTSGTTLAWVNANAHSHTAADISDFAEAVDDRVGLGLFQNSASILFTYNDVAGTLTPERAALGGDVTAAQNVNALVVNQASSAFGLTGVISDLGLAVSQNNYSPTGLATASTIRVSSTGPIDITGLAGVAAGRLIFIFNVGANAITLKDESGSSTAGNRFALNADIVLSADQSCGVIYDNTTQRWRASGAPAAVTGALTDGNKTDITVSFGGTVWEINAGAVGFSEMVDIVTDSLIGRDTAGTGDPENITLNATLSMTGTGALQRAALTGDVTANAGSNTTSIANGVVTFAKMQNINTDRLLGRDTAASGVVEEISLTGGLEFNGTQGIQTSAFTGDVTKASGGTVTTISADAVTYAKMQNVTANQRVLGLSTGAPADPTELTATTVLDWIGSTRGSVLYRGVAGWAALTPGTSGFALTSQGPGADPIWSASSAVVADGDKGDISITGGVWSVDADVVTFAKMQNINTQRVIGRNTAASGDPEEVTVHQELDWITTTQGSILVRGAATWAGLGAGTSGFVLTSNGPGVAPSYQAAAAATVPGSPTNSVQYNNGGVFAGDAGMTYNAGSDTLTLLGSLNLGNASDTTISRTGAGAIAVAGVPVAMTGKQTIYIPAGSMTAKGTAGAESTTRTINGITLPVQKFDTASAEGVNFSVAFPKSWNNGTVTYQVFWTAASGSGSVIFSLKGGCFADAAAITTGGLGTGVTVTDNLLAADQMHVSVESGAVTVSAAAVDRLALFELVRDISDTLGVDAELIGVKFFYTTNLGNDA